MRSFSFESIDLAANVAIEGGLNGRDDPIVASDLFLDYVEVKYSLEKVLN
jgi:hypothetical protein